MGICDTYIKGHNAGNANTTKLRIAQRRRRCVIHDVFNHIQVLRFKGSNVDKWLNTLSKLTNVPRSSDIMH